MVISERRQKKVLFFLTLAVLVAVLIPLFVISVYNFRSVDDYSYALNAEKIWKETRNVFLVIKEQFGFARYAYFHNQGTFAGEWITSTLIAIFSENAYYMGTVFSLGGFVLSEGFMLMLVLKKGLGADKYDAGLITCWCIILQVLMTPYPAEAYYWFCGSALYTLIHALAFLLISLMFRFCSLGSGSVTVKKGRLIMLQVGIILLSLIVGTGTYITLLVVFLLYVFLDVGVWYKKHPYRVLVSIDSIIYIGAFLVNVLAPGNQNRLDVVGAEKNPVIQSIMKAVYAAVEYCFRNAILPVMILTLMLLPIMIKVVNVKKYRFPFPALVSILSFGVFAAQFVPCIYTLDYIGVGRIQNIYRHDYYLWIFGNELYWTGWYLRVRRERYENRGDFLAGAEDAESAGNGTSDVPGGHGAQYKPDESVRTIKRKQMPYLLCGGLTAIVLFFYSLTLWGGSTVTTFSAITALRTGQAQQYYAEYQERLEILKDENIKVAYLKPFSAPPYLLYFNDLQKDPRDWVNKAMAACYGKEDVILLEP